MSDATRALIERAMIPWNTGDTSVFDTDLAEGAIYHLPPVGDMDVAALKQYIPAFRMAQPDFKVRTDEVIIAGDRVACRYTCSGTLTGVNPLMPMEPTGRRQETTGLMVVHLEGGKVREVWNSGDWLGALQQFGVIPPLGG